MVHVAQYKKDIVAEFEKIMGQYPIVGTVDMENLPTKTLQNMREMLRGKALIKMTKKRLMRIALAGMKDKMKDIDKLEQYLTGMPALMFTKENPFTLFQQLQRNKSNAPAKAGQVAPKDIVIPAGPTPFAPGPVIGELGAFGIKTGVEGGKVAIKDDKVVAKEGELISGKLAELLTRLGIEPMEIGLNVTAIWEDGIIFQRGILDINMDQYAQDVKTCAQEVFNLAFFAGYTTTDNIKLFVQRTFLDSKAVALFAGFPADGIVEDLVTKAERQALGLKNKLGLEA